MAGLSSLLTTLRCLAPLVVAHHPPLSRACFWQLGSARVLVEEFGVSAFEVSETRVTALMWTVMGGGPAAIDLIQVRAEFFISLLLWGLWGVVVVAMLRGVSMLMKRLPACLSVCLFCCVLGT